MKESETIGRIVHDSGRAYNVLEMLSTEKGSFLLEGEQLQPFSSEIIKAIQSGYLLKDCADDRLRSVWRRLVEERGDVGRVVAFSGTTATADSAGVAPAESAGGTSVSGEAEERRSQASRGEAEESADIQVAETSEMPIMVQPENGQTQEREMLSAVSDNLENADLAASEEPELQPFLRDRRSPESPASEEIRLRIAARDRDMDSLMAKFPIQESSEAEVTEARDDVVAIPVDSVSHVDVTFQVNPAKPVVEDRPEPIAAVANIADAPEVKTDDDVKPESTKAEAVITENPFALF